MRYLPFLFVVLATAEAYAAERSRYVPSSDDEVLLTLPSKFNPRAQQLEILEENHRAQPDDLGRATALARSYVEYARTAGDARYLGRAEGVIEPYLKQGAPPVAARVLHAIILQARHQFAEARSVLNDVVRIAPSDVEAWLTIAAITLVQGDLGATRGACARLLFIGDALVASGCASAVATATGNAAAGASALREVMQRSTAASPEVRAWAHGLLASAAESVGDQAQAEKEYRAGLEAVPSDGFLLAAYADLLLDEKRYADVEVLLAGNRQSDPLFLRLVFAEWAMHFVSAEADKAEMAQRFAALHRRGDSPLYAREEARFLLSVQHDPAGALELAGANWKQQKTSEDARIVLEAACAAQRPEAAREVVDFIEQTHLADVRLRPPCEQLRITSPQ